MKKLLIAGAAGVMVFGFTAASASTLNLAGAGSYFHHTVQQSDAATASCVNGNLEVSLQVEGTVVKHVELFQQYIQGCAGSEAQVVAYDSNGDRIGQTDTPRIQANGRNLSLTFNAPIDAQKIASTRVTIADDIVSPA
jgi:hypothetical protein